MSFLLYLIAYIIVGWDIVYKAIRNISHGQVFDENFLMCVATFGAFGVREYEEAVAVMLFYQVGELFQNYAVNRSRQSITELMDICPEYANIEENGELKKVDPVMWKWATLSLSNREKGSSGWYRYIGKFFYRHIRADRRIRTASGF